MKNFSGVKSDSFMRIYAEIRVYASDLRAFLARERLLSVYPRGRQTGACAPNKIRGKRRNKEEPP